MSSPGEPTRLIAEIRYADGQSGISYVGKFPIHQYWPRLSSHFRGVFLAPQRRSDGAGVSWMWRPASDARPPTAGELADLRKRLGDASRRFAEDPFGLGGDSPGAVTTESLAKQLAQRVEEMTAAFVAKSDADLSAYVARTDAGLRLHSWGSSTPATPQNPSAQRCEVSGVVLASDKPAAGVSVLLETAKGLRCAQTESDSSGRFSFSDVTPGAYRVRARSGHVPFSSKGVAVQVEQTSVTGIELRSTAIVDAAEEDEEKLEEAPQDPAVTTSVKAQAVEPEQPRERSRARRVAGVLVALLLMLGAIGWLAAHLLRPNVEVRQQARTGVVVAPMNGAAQGHAGDGEEERGAVGSSGLGPLGANGATARTPRVAPAETPATHLGRVAMTAPRVGPPGDPSGAAAAAVGGMGEGAMPNAASAPPAGGPPAPNGAGLDQSVADPQPNVAKAKPSNALRSRAQEKKPDSSENAAESPSSGSSENSDTASDSAKTNFSPDASQADEDKHQPDSRGKDVDKPSLEPARSAKSPEAASKTKAAGPKKRSGLGRGQPAGGATAGAPTGANSGAHAGSLAPTSNSDGDVAAQTTEQPSGESDPKTPGGSASGEPSSQSAASDSGDAGAEPADASDGVSTAKDSATASSPPAAERERGAPVARKTRSSRGKSSPAAASAASSPAGGPDRGSGKTSAGEGESPNSASDAASSDADERADRLAEATAARPDAVTADDADAAPEASDVQSDAKQRATQDEPSTRNVEAKSGPLAKAAGARDVSKIAVRAKENGEATLEKSSPSNQADATVSSGRSTQIKPQFPSAEAPLPWEHRLQYSAWRAKLVRDVIVPTVPRGAGEPEQLETLVQETADATQKRMPEMFRSPAEHVGFVFVVDERFAARRGVLRWTDEKGGTVALGSVNGPRAEIEWTAAESKRFVSASLRAANGTELVSLILDRQGRLTLRGVPEVKAWLWLGLRRPATEIGEMARVAWLKRLTWRSGDAEEVPTGWIRNDAWLNGRGHRVDIPLDAAASSSDTFAVTLFDRQTGWSLSRTIATR